MRGIGASRFRVPEAALGFSPTFTTMAATAPQVTSVSTAESFTCITCHMLFAAGAEQREHYKSEVHRFNLKRKVAGLAPVTAEVYESKQQGM